MPSSPLHLMASHVDLHTHELRRKGAGGKKVENVSTGREKELLIQSLFFLPLSPLKFSLANYPPTHFSRLLHIKTSK